MRSSSEQTLNSRGLSLKLARDKGVAVGSINHSVAISDEYVMHLNVTYQTFWIVPKKNKE